MTVRLVVDEHISGALMRGLRLLVEDVDVVRVQDVGLRMATDQAILDWAATEGRILVTQDIRTMPDFAYDR